MKETLNKEEFLELNKVYLSLKYKKCGYNSIEDYEREVEKITE